MTSRPAVAFWMCRPRTSEPRYTQVATTLVPLNIPLSCAKNPVRKPVLPSDKMFPIVYKMANLVGLSHIRLERKEQKTPALTQIANPYRRCMRESSKQSLSSSSSGGGSDGSMPTISFTWSMAVFGIVVP